MKIKTFWHLACCLALALPHSQVCGQGNDVLLKDKVRSVVDSTYELPVARTDEAQNYELLVDMTIQTADVERVKQISYRLALDCQPLEPIDDVGQRVEYTCREFAIDEGEHRATLPSLKDWSYQFTYPTANLAPQGNVFGLPRARFQGLSDSHGTKLNPQSDFLVYNAFTDYHVLCNVYAQRMFGDGGIQSLSRVGDRVEHGTSNTTAPLGDVPGLSEGSQFVHGEVALTFKGISRVGRRPCVLVGFEATGNEFKMIIKPVPSYSVISQGKSRHFGDLYIDLESGWITKATMNETAANWVDMNGKKTGPTVIHRRLTLQRR